MSGETGKNGEAVAHLTCPLGVLAVHGTPAGITAVRFLDGPPPAPPDAPVTSPVLRQALEELRAYFVGMRRVFSAPLLMRGTDFQMRVWQVVAQIPYGETRTYLEIARSVGDEGAVRAVGLANGSNPLPIFVPCHRVIGSDGSLTGYGGGLWRKERLLVHEGRPAQPRLFEF